MTSGTQGENGMGRKRGVSRAPRDAAPLTHPFWPQSLLPTCHFQAAQKEDSSRGHCRPFSACCGYVVLLQCHGRDHLGRFLLSKPLYPRAWKSLPGVLTEGAGRWGLPRTGRGGTMAGTYKESECREAQGYMVT